MMDDLRRYREDPIGWLDDVLGEVRAKARPFSWETPNEFERRVVRIGLAEAERRSGTPARSAVPLPPPSALFS